MKEMNSGDLRFLETLGAFTKGWTSDTSKIKEWQLVGVLALAKGWAHPENFEDDSEGPVAVCLRVLLYEYVRRHGQEEAEVFLESLCD